MPSLPFVKVADQEDMKLALMLNVIDPTIGGVLIMGERGTGKSVAVRYITALKMKILRVQSPEACTEAYLCLTQDVWQAGEGDGGPPTTDRGCGR